MKKLILLIIALIVLFVLLGLERLETFTLDHRNTREVGFTHGENQLSGTLLLPDGVAKAPVALIVHGDGAADRFLEGTLHPFANELLDAGIGLYAWDKPGVGASSGDWLQQSMQDRADEAAAAYDALRAQPGVDADHIGYLGFSQAGWVIPQAANATDPSFAVILGGALNWRQQGVYHQRKRLEAQGLSPALAEEEARSAQLTYDKTYLSPPMVEETARQRFVRRNYRSDASAALSQMHTPVLALWGSDDLNVDPLENSASYAQLLPKGTDATLSVLPKATHALLDSDLFNYQSLSDWSATSQYLFLLLGADAYAANSLQKISSWIRSRSNLPATIECCSG
jgi:pimeloyl-ACP methyl ester carboxylesterase